jgi:hypothetical protein
MMWKRDLPATVGAKVAVVVVLFGHGDRGDAVGMSCVCLLVRDGQEVEGRQGFYSTARGTRTPAMRVQIIRKGQWQRRPIRGRARSTV